MMKDGERTGGGARRVDRRVLRSRRSMVEAFKRLVAQKPYSDITVTDIAREADVDRKTFYMHFGSIDGLLAYILDQHIEEIVHNTHALLLRDGEPLEERLDARLRTFLEMVNVSIMENISLNRLMFQYIPFDLLLSCISSSMLEELRRYHALPQGVSEDLIEYSLTFVFGGILSAYRMWAVSDGSVPIESVSNAVSDMAAEGIASLAFFDEGSDTVPSV